jgi:serine/threonine-protein kinase
LISGKYRLYRQLGAGGMGSVWAARNELTDRDFAVKFLLPDLAHNKEALHRFFLEARACGQIKHPAIVDVYDMGQAEDGSPYLVMEMLEGEGFDQRLQRSGIVRAGDACAWIAFVARGLEEAHMRGLIHRDLKPGNIFFAIDSRGDIVPKLLDFGVSKATGIREGDNFVKTTTGAVLGSPAYMSPEQARGEGDVDGRSDVWSLGVILYESLTGDLPFDAPNYNALMLSIITKEHRKVCEVAPHVPIALSELVDQALSKEREKRIGTASELADRLEALAETLNARIPLKTSLISGVTNAPQPSALTAAQLAPRQFSTTEGTWSDGKKTVAKKRSSTILVTASLLVATLATAATIAALQLRGPMVAVAGRTVVAINSSLAHLRQELDEAAAAEAAAKAKAAAEKAAAEAKAKSEAAATSSAQPSASAEPASAPGKVGGIRRGPLRRGGKAQPSGEAPSAPSKGPSDANGGVDSAGF